MILASRLPGLLLLAVVILAAALLVAGLGVAVGIGVLVGVALGLVAAFVAATRQPRGAGSIFGTRQLHEPDLELISRHGRQWTAVSAIEMSPLHRVIAAGTATETEGIRIELVAVELHDDGGIAIVVARARPPATIGQFLEVGVADDVGTTYAAAGQSSGSPSPAVGRIDLRFAPAPPAAARQLTLRIGAFIDPFPGPARRFDGPWSLRVDLTPEA